MQTIILALIQGFTEFLPISSSGHLILPTQLLGWTEQGLTFDIAVHIGTLIAVIGYFRNDLYQIIKDCLIVNSLGNKNTVNSRLGWYLILATIPTVVFGFALKRSNLYTAIRNIGVITSTTLIFGILLGWANITGKRVQSIITYKQAIIIGLAQAIAVIPGTSRSGITISAGLMLGLTWKATIRFSFLLSIPVIIGAGLLLVLDILAASEPIDWSIFCSGTMIAAVSAWICIHFFLSYFNKIGLMPFVIYRLILGIILIMIK